MSHAIGLDDVTFALGALVVPGTAIVGFFVIVILRREDPHGHRIPIGKRIRRWGKSVLDVLLSM